ncbi:tRNA(Met) cytidine acetyltransferase TmcA [Halomarina rubra]|uniref:tRNA(Met) cytidine acetyltransferase TmcA n=1 Tax=Halomarina rubra TaxID=2071873 RepID=A0ABD6B070_9EURY|nr:tRNA(Met) cytidine acetyltransferase TmcA [Halomarina rubra]
MLGSLAQSLRAEARRTDERRCCCLAGDADPETALREVLDAADLATDAVLVGHRDLVDLPRHEPRQAGALLGTTHDCVVVDLRDECRPNALGRSVGAVDGGGLLVVVTPPLDAWPTRRDRFDETLAVPPNVLADVAGNFRRRLAALLRVHRGIAVVDLDSWTVERDGLTDPAPVRPRPDPTPPARHAFPRVAYDTCLTDDQVAAVHAFEALRDPDAAVVCTADRGRGKSSAAGLAAGSLAAAGRDVLVTAGDRRGATELFARARAVLDELGVLLGDGGTDTLRAVDGGRVRFAAPADAVELPADPDVVFVDEAAGLPVGLLASFLGRVPVGYATTLHGYEGAGRGFAVRFRERLTDGDADVTEVTMTDPIRYAASDPVEPWAFRALLLDANPPVEPLVVDATPDTVEYVAPSPEDLLADEHLLREAFGLLVLAHYKTEPDDLARLLDAPNLTTHLLTHDGHVVAVALVAREGGLDAATCAEVYREGRVQGNMLPDLMTGQLRDPDAARPVGRRVVRIAVHPQVQSRKLGSRLLAALHDEFDDADWFGTSFGATPRLLEFWQANGYRPVHLSATRNATSGEHSAALLCGDSPLVDRHTRWFRERVGDVLADTLRDVDVDVVRRTLAGTAHDPPDLTAREWRLVAAAAYGPGQFDMHPGPFRRLALAALTAPDGVSDADGDPSDARERLLVRRVLQCHDWETVADDLGYYTASGARRELGRTLQTLVERYGTKAAADERDRYG